MTQRIIILCGPDRCGKTEIGKELSRVTGIPYFKAISEHDSYLSSKASKREAFLNQLRYADPRVFDILKQTGHSIIFDRAFPCELVYSKVMGRETDMTMLTHMDEMWASINVKIILCQRTSYVGIVDDIDSDIESHMLNELHREYNEFVEWSKCEVYKLNVDDEDLDREVKEVLEFIA